MSNKLMETASTTADGVLWFAVQWFEHTEGKRDANVFLPSTALLAIVACGDKKATAHSG